MFRVPAGLELCFSVFANMHACVVSCFRLCDPMDCSPPGSSVHGILQARILERFAISSSKGSSWCRDRTPISCYPCNSCIGQRILYHFSHLGSKDFCRSTEQFSLNAWWELTVLLVSLSFCLSAARRTFPLRPYAVCWWKGPCSFTRSRR